MMTPEERAKALCLLMGRNAYEDFVSVLRHARREAYEKAAKVADNWWHTSADTTPSALAAAIRRLAEEG